MVSPALYDFAEAALGHNAQMQWSMSEDIIHRQMAPVFDQCARGDLEAEQALNASMHYVLIKKTYGMEVLVDLYRRLVEELKTDGEQPYPAMAGLDEFFMGLSAAAEWGMNEDIMKDEFRPLFLDCAGGELTSKQALDLFVGLLFAKKDYVHGVLQGMTRELSLQIQAREKSQVTNGDKA